MNFYDISLRIREIMDEGPEYPDENELTRKLKNLLSKNHRIKFFRLNQNDEGKYGADWVWFIITDNGVYQFVVQAKKIESNKKSISKRQASYNHRLQIENLIQLGKQISATPIYVLFANQIDKIPCGSSNPDTKEGVFFDLAENIYNEFFKETKPGTKHMPLSCLFACFSKKCHYKIPEASPICVVCKRCKKKSCIPLKSSSPCLSPFENTIKTLFGGVCKRNRVSEKLLLVMFAESVIDKEKKFTKFCFDESLFKQNIIDNIIITDYTNRHSGNFMQTILGNDFEVDNKDTLKYDYICDVLIKNIKKFPLFEKIGIFGSYAKDTATPQSDVDIALVYDHGKFKTETDLQKIIDFLKSVTLELKKNIDFVDYAAAENDSNFYNDISSYIRWLEF